MAHSLLSQMLDVPVAVVDVETTGASAGHGDRVIEIGVVRVERGLVVAEYQQLIDPGRRISWGITALTGITNEMVAGQPTFAQQLPQLDQLLSNSIVLGHNIRFDLSFIHREYRRAGVDLQTVVGAGNHVLDTVRMARRRFGRGGNGLGRLARRLGIEPVTAHRALADAQTTHQVFHQMIEPVGGWAMTLVDVLREQGGPMPLLPANSTADPLPLELEEALDNQKPVLMEYLDARQQRTQRVVRPLQIRRFRGEMILIAHCELRNDRRTFKVERIVQLNGIEEPPELTALAGT